MQKILVFLIASFVFLAFVSFISPKKEKIEWLTVEELQTAYHKNPKPILVDVYTGWCGWCKVMDRETYSMDKVAAYINEHYYALKFDAERKDSVLWDGKKYGYDPANRANELAAYFTYGRMSYPTTVFLTALNARPAPMAGYLKPGELEPLVKFFGDGAYKTLNYQEFISKFSKSW